MKKDTLLILLAIVSLGFCLRFIGAENLPRILNRDEAALAYNGLLISQTGTDEFGRPWPLTFESFGDYKLPGYIYTLAGFFKILSPSDLTVRLPSIIAGTWLIFIAFFVTKNLKIGPQGSLIASLLIAINPIFWFYSRIAFEANVALAFFVTAIYFFTKSKPSFHSDLLGLVLIALSVLFYNTPLILLPFFTISLIIFRGLQSPKKWLSITIAMGLIFIAFYLSLSDLTKQKKGITWFNDETTWNESVNYYNSFSGLNQKLFGNKYIFFGQKIVNKYLESFSPKFLVISGGTHPWHALSNWGHVYWPTYLLAIIGIVFLIKNIRKNNIDRTLLMLLFFSLIPSVITVDAPHATRSLFFFFLLAIISAQATTRLPKTLKTYVLPLFITWQILSSIAYGYNYFFIFPNNQPASLMTGFAEKIVEIEKTYPNANVAIVDPSGYQYILAAWYLKTPPEQFIQTIIKQQPDRIGFKYGQQLTHYHFIANAADRDVSESILLEWSNNLWQIR